MGFRSTLHAHIAIVLTDSMKRSIESCMPGGRLSQYRCFLPIQMIVEHLI